MHLQKLDLNLLVALEALLSTQSVTRAAEKLSISQPAMSGALNRLREHFGDPLIQRSGRSMILTPFGLDLSRRVGHLLASTTELVQMRPGFDPLASDRTFTVVASDYVMPIFLPLLLPQLAVSAPSIRIDLETRSVDYVRRFTLGLIDLVVVPKPMALQECSSVELFDDEYVCIVSRDNRHVDSRPSQADYLKLGHIVRVNPDAGGYSGDERAIREMGLARRVVATVPAFGMLPAAIVGTPWIATVQRRLAEQAIEHHPIRILPHPLKLPKLTMVMQWPVIRDQDAGGQWLREQFLRISEGLRHVTARA
ncbi:LysR family transcriptional regulator [Pigmentiphaga sp. GD03639]|uniref:LysR family transcriptional regulator n=1 Tax=unclassified Pigmentiphaga TaxID=2626614 RepID=UPI000B416AED|nr:MULTISPECIES: LysR family transcriptional regulator [unclassified Pigmentiphaga]MDH2234712.1 LysR family transcriptional regulator [Pigmentiphaga sp. GD03639]OVZ64438.1 hypothetical protein CDO46_08935 [Pigmentiphaga sp. NML030171]